MKFEVPQCATCAHFDHQRWTCTAYTEGIPMPIQRGEHDHRKPYAGDNGIRYEARQPIEQRDASA